MSQSFTPEHTEITKNNLNPLRVLRALGGKTILTLSASVAGIAIAVLPLRYSVVAILGGALLIAAIVEPLVGLAIMLLLGPAEPLLGAAGLLPFSIGQITFALFAGAWLLRGLARRQLRWPHLPIAVPLFLYLIAAALSVAVQHPPSPLDGATELLKWGEMYFIAAIVVDAAGRKRLSWVVAIVLGAGLFQSGIGIWQFQFRGHGPQAFKILGDHYRAYGTLEQPNPFGGLMGIVWPLAAAVAAQAGFKIIRPKLGTLMNADKPQPNADHFDEYENRKNQRSSAFNLRILRSPLWLASATTLATLGALFLSFSRGAWLGAGAAGLAMLVFWPRRRWVGLGLGAGGLVVILGLYNLGLLPSFIASRFTDVSDFIQVYDVRGVHINDSNFSIIERLAHWQAAIRMADANPLFGVGFGNYEAAYDDYRLINWRYALGHAHMIYLNVLAETGAVGLAAYLILWGSIFAVTLRVIAYNDPSGVQSPKGLNLNRAMAIGLLGSWVHLSTHQLLDNLYVGNIPFIIGALFGILCIIHSPPTGVASARP